MRMVKNLEIVFLSTTFDIVNLISHCHPPSKFKKSNYNSCTCGRIQRGKVRRRGNYNVINQSRKQLIATKFTHAKSFVNTTGERNNGKLIADWVNTGL